MKALLALLLCTPAAFAGPLPIESQTGVLRVSSEYEPGTTELGTGVLLKLPDLSPRRSPRYFVATCAHLTGGKNIQIAGQPLEQVSKGRFTDAFHDLDLIEVEPSLAGIGGTSDAAATYFAEIRVRHNGAIWVNEAALAAWKKSQEVLSVDPRQENATFALKPDWSAKKLAAAPNRARRKDFNQPDRFSPDTFSLSDIYRSGGIVYNYIGSTYWAPARIAPGMSCAPLVSTKDSQLIGPNPVRSSNIVYNPEKPLMRGLGVEFKNQMHGSTFASDYLILQALGKYLSGGSAGPFTGSWKSQNGLLYLALGKDRAEIVPNAAGNGVSTPPGNGVSTPPGKGTAKAATCSPTTLSLENGWEKAGTPPAILWDGKKVMGFRIQFPKEADRPALLQREATAFLFPDRAGIEFRLKAAKYAAKIEDVPLGSTILDALDLRFDADMKRIRGEPSLKPPYSVRGSTVLETVARGPRFDRYPDHVDFTLYGTDGEKIEFRLNDRGALVGQGHNDPGQFLPVIEVRGPSGKIYVVDLTNFFHVEAANAQAPYYHMITLGESQRIWMNSLFDQPGVPPEEIRKTFQYMMLKLQETPPRISYKEKCSENEQVFSFTHQDPLVLEEPGCQEALPMGSFFPELRAIPFILRLRPTPANY